MLDLLFSSRWSSTIAVVAGLGALVAWWQIDRAGQRHVGRLEERQQQGERWHAQVDKARAARERASTGAVAGGLRVDPFTRAD